MLTSGFILARPPRRDGYDAGASGASNLGPSNDVLLDQVATRVADYRTAQRPRR